MNFLQQLAFCVKYPRHTLDAECFFCHAKPALDFADGDFVCQTCWDNYIPSYEED